MNAPKKKIVHTIPVGGDEPLHQADGECWCFPFNKGDGVAVHNAKDARERLERQGVKHDGKWVLILEAAE